MIGPCPENGIYSTWRGGRGIGLTWPDQVLLALCSRRAGDVDRYENCVLVAVNTALSQLTLNWHFIGVCFGKLLRLFGWQVTNLYAFCAELCGAINCHSIRVVGVVVFSDQVDHRVSFIGVHNEPGAILLERIHTCEADIVEAGQKSNPKRFPIVAVEELARFPNMIVVVVSVRVSRVKLFVAQVGAVVTALFDNTKNDETNDGQGDYYYNSHGKIQFFQNNTTNATWFNCALSSEAAA